MPDPVEAEALLPLPHKELLLTTWTSVETMLVEEMFGSLRPGMLALADRQSFHQWIKAVDTSADLVRRVVSNLILRPMQMVVDGSYIPEVIPPRKSGRASFRLRVNRTLDSLTEALYAEGIVIGRRQVGRILLAEGVRWRKARS